MPRLIEKPAVDSITRLIRSHNIPLRMISELTKDIEMGLKMFRQISQRNFLTKCCSLNICPREIKSLAARITSNRTRIESQEYENMIMKHRIKYIENDILSMKQEWIKSSQNLSVSNEMNKEVKLKFKEIRQNQIDGIKYKERI